VAGTRAVALLERFDSLFYDCAPATWSSGIKAVVPVGAKFRYGALVDLPVSVPKRNFRSRNR
jgi:hypothetical protein